MYKRVFSRMLVFIISICACIHPAFVQARITYKLYTDAAGLIHRMYLGFNLCCCAVVVALLYLFFAGIVVIVVIFVVVVVVVDVVYLIFSFPHLIPSSHFILLPPSLQVGDHYFLTLITMMRSSGAYATLKGKATQDRLM